MRENNHFSVAMLVIGPVTFHLYGLLIGLGILVGGWVAAKKEKSIYDALVWVVAGGIIGARFYHVMSEWQFYRLYPGEIVALWHGGLGIYRAIAGWLVGLWLYCLKHNQSFRKLLDAVALGLPLGQAIGRLGNYFNQELYGRPTALPWGIYIQAEDNYFHPLFLYEALWCLLGWIIIKRIKKPGKIMAIYLGWYGLGRFFLEFLRLDSWMVGGVNVAQAVSAILVAVGLISL